MAQLTDALVSVTGDLGSARIRAVFEDAGVRGWLHAIALDDPESTIAVDADDVVPMASVYKLPLLAGFCRLVDLGEVDPRERLTLDPSTRTAGPTGLSLFADPVTLSLRDLAVSMMTVSDNASADALLDVVGLPRLAELAEVLRPATDLGTTRDRGQPASPATPDRRGQSGRGPRRTRGQRPDRSGRGL